MDSLPVIKPKKVIDALIRGGFYLHHQTGSHARLVHRIKPDIRVTVLVHSKDIPRGTLKRIIKQADQ